MPEVATTVVSSIAAQRKPFYTWLVPGVFYNQLETVLRDAMTADSLDPTGIYFGTRSGRIFGSRDEGRTWQKILQGLPAVVCIRTAVVEEAAAGSVPTLPKTPLAASSRTKSSAISKSLRTKR